MPSRGTSKSFLSNAESGLPPMVCDRRFIQSASESANTHPSVGNSGNFPPTAGGGTSGTAFGHIPEWMLNRITPNKKQGVLKI